MKIDHRITLWRGRNGRLWRLADRLESTAQAVRYANKPYDLVFPITTLTDLTNQVRKMMWEWLAEKLKHL
jgi:hypothetical protein